MNFLRKNSVCWRIFIVFIISTLCGQISLAQEKNIALHKPYEFSHKVNYKYLDAKVSRTSLTDGVVDYDSKKAVWLQSTSAGWVYQQKVSITVDLKKDYPVSRVCFHTVKREKSGIYFPDHVFVYLSKDNQHFHYAGDMMAGKTIAAKRYQIRNFQLDGINAQARYVKFYIVPHGKFAFTNEIAVYSSGKKNRTFAAAYERSSYPLTKNDIEDKLKTALINQKEDLILDKSRQRVSEAIDQSLTKINSTTQLRKIYSDYLSSKYSKPFVVEKVSPWQDFKQFTLPVNVGEAISYDAIVPVNQHFYGGLKITNTSGAKQLLNIDFTSIELGSLSLFKGEYVTAKESKELDPLIPYSPGTTITLLPGESQVIVFKFKGESAGAERVPVEVTANNYKREVKLNLDVIKLNNNVPKLNAINWAYFNKPLLKDKKIKAIQDLEAHHINTFVSPTKVLGWLTGTNVAEMKRYFAEIDRSSNIVMYYSIGKNETIRTAKGAISFMSGRWKNVFKRWYKQRFDALVEMGFSPNKIYFYPFDEPRGEQVNEFIRFSKWARSAIPELKLFTTALTHDALKVKEYTDILVVSNRLDLKKIRPKIPQDAWFYSIISWSRIRSAYSNYRLMAWKAFYYDFKGIGFWNYAAFNKKEENKVSSLYLKGNKDYSVIYTNGNKIISSRRWEAFSKGLEDYKILSAYAAKYGRDKTKQLVKKVVEHRANVQLADKVLNRMLQALK